MGTRGAYGIRFDGADKVTYNHWYSYPSGLGDSLLAEIKGFNIDEMATAFKRMQVVTEEWVPTDAEAQHYMTVGGVDLNVGEQSVQDWYCLTRNFQGKIAPWFDGRQEHILDGGDFLADSLFCEWAYIINLDDETLEVYKGFNQNPNTAGRYAKLTDGSYYGVRLVDTFKLDSLPDSIDALKYED